MFLQPGSLTIILPPATLCFYFSREGSRLFSRLMDRRGMPGRSETGQKQRWMQDSAHPSIHLVFRLICPKSGSSYCIGNRRQAVEPLHVCFRCVTGLISWETPALSLAAVSRFSQLQQDWWLARATDWLTTSHDVGMFLQPGSLTILLPPTTLYLKFLFLQSRVSFFCDGSKKHPRKVRNRSETCQKQGVDARFSPSIHPSSFQIDLSQIGFFILHRKSKTGC